MSTTLASLAFPTYATPGVTGVALSVRGTTRARRRAGAALDGGTALAPVTAIFALVWRARFGAANDATDLWQDGVSGRDVAPENATSIAAQTVRRHG